MENAQQILVVILSSALALLLVLTIILMVLFIKIAKHIKNITQNAEAISERAEDVAEFFSSAATPIAAGKLISNVFESFMGKKRRSKK